MHGRFNGEYPFENGVGLRNFAGVGADEADGVSVFRPDTALSDEDLAVVDIQPEQAHPAKAGVDVLHRAAESAAGVEDALAVAQPARAYQKAIELPARALKIAARSGELLGAGQ